jgi:hemerythrin
MALMEWRESYSVNVKVFDQHHQHLFDLINTLHDSMRVGKGREALDEVLHALEDYAQRHFSAEETLMRKTGYDGLTAHALEHRKFMDKVHSLIDQHESGKTVVTQALMTFLCDWLKTHIAMTDRGYTPHMVAHRVQ